MRPLFITGPRIILLLVFMSLFFFGPSWISVTAHQAADMTPTPYGPFITVTYIEPINVRTGPSSFDYPVIGSIPVGGTAPALGRSPAGEWIQITFPGAPRGIGWVYAANVSLSPNALLPIVEPPPTPVPVESPTVNPTFAAAFQASPTSTRLPTFTAPPQLVIPTYGNPAGISSGRIQTGWLIVGLGLIGLIGIAITSFRRR
jgi:hypothetical protein